MNITLNDFLKKFTNLLPVMHESTLNIFLINIC